MTSAFIAGASVSTDQALQEAASMLAGARLPLVTGLEADVLTIRAAHRLAAVSGGVIDHQASSALFPFISAFRDAGLIMGVPSEIRRRADSLLLIGDDIDAAWPDFMSYLAAPLPDLSSVPRKARKVLWLGAPETLPAVSGGVALDVLPCAQTLLTEAIGVLRAELAGHPHRNGPLDAASLARLAGFVREAAFGAVLWSVRATDAVGHEMVAGLVKDLNADRRFTALPVHAEDGGYGAALVSTYVTGFPLRVSYGTGAPVHDPYAFAGDRLQKSGDADLVLCVNTRAGAEPCADAAIAIGPGLAANAARVVLSAEAPVDAVWFRRELGSFASEGRAGEAAGMTAPVILNRIAQMVGERVGEAA